MLPVSLLIPHILCYENKKSSDMMEIAEFVISFGKMS